MKTFARLFHALGEEITIVPKKKRESESASKSQKAREWKWTFADPNIREKLIERSRREQLVAVVRESVVSNDNYNNQVVIWDEKKPSLTLKALKVA